MWIHLRKERFPSKRRSKFLLKSDGPFDVLEKINPNAYKVDLPEEYGVFATFNMADWSPYLKDDDDLPNLRTNSFQAKGNDRDHSHVLPMIKDLQKTCQELEINRAFQNSLQPDASSKWPNFLTRCPNL